MGRGQMYAVWRGDECLAVGTVAELAERFKVKPETVKWWASPTAHRRADECEGPCGRKVAERI